MLSQPRSSVQSCSGMARPSIGILAALCAFRKTPTSIRPPRFVRADERPTLRTRKEKRGRFNYHPYPDSVYLAPASLIPAPNAPRSLLPGRVRMRAINEPESFLLPLANLHQILHLRSVRST